MNEAEIRKYASLMRELDLTGIEIDEKNGVIRRKERRILRRAVPSSPARELFRKAEWLPERRDMPERLRLQAPWRRRRTEVRRYLLPRPGSIRAWEFWTA